MICIAVIKLMSARENVIQYFTQKNKTTEKVNFAKKSLSDFNFQISMFEINFFVDVMKLEARCDFNLIYNVYSSFPPSACVVLQSKKREKKRYITQRNR